jgi:hypothetical protein
MDGWRRNYDRWRLASPPEPVLDEDGEPIDQDELDARAEDAAVERAERQREDAMFDAPDREERLPYDQ